MSLSSRSSLGSIRGDGVSFLTLRRTNEGAKPKIPGEGLLMSYYVTLLLKKEVNYE